MDLHLQGVFSIVLVGRLFLKKRENARIQVNLWHLSSCSLVTGPSVDDSAIQSSALVGSSQFCDDLCLMFSRPFPFIRNEIDVYIPGPCPVVI